MFIIALRQHVSILIESPSGPSNNTHRYLAIFKTPCGIPNVYILDITMYKMYVLLCYDCTIRILISKTLPVHMKEVKRVYLKYIVIERWILLPIIKYVCKR